MAAAFTAFLSSLRPDDRLYLLGDVFDYWIGDDDLDDAFNQRMLQSMALTTARGVQLQLMHGNRDFLLGERFEVLFEEGDFGENMTPELAEREARLRARSAARQA